MSVCSLHVPRQNRRVGKVQCPVHLLPQGWGVTSSQGDIWKNKEVQSLGGEAVGAQSETCLPFPNAN